jgi:hypothetical protein
LLLNNPPLQLTRKPFYESDCQGRTYPSLIAHPFHLWQSAPASCWMRLSGVLGVTEQSSSASLSLLQLLIRLDVLQAVGSRDANHGSI